MDGDSRKTEYMDFVRDNYDKIKKLCATHQTKRGEKFDEDTFHETLLKVDDIYQRKGLKDTSDNGFTNYTFMAFRTNIMREKQYRNNQCARFTDELGKTTEDEENVMLAEVMNYFAICYIFDKVENEIDPESFNIYRLKTIGGQTYKTMSDKYGISQKKLKEAVTKVRRYIRNNISMKDIKREFHEQY